MAMFEVDIGSLRTTVMAMRNQRIAVAAAKRESTEKGGERALDRVKRNVSARKYSLSDLAQMGHPYARKHGGIQSSVLGGRYRYKPYLVHTRSGQLRSGIKGYVAGGAYNIAATGQHARFVIGGTQHMLRRDVLVDTFNEDGTRRVILREIARVLGQKLRTQATIRGTPRNQHPSATEV